MILLYRGIPYEINNQSVENPLTPETTEHTTPPKVRLLYRGTTYEYQPQPKSAPAGDLADAPTVTLIYRGLTYQRKLSAPSAYQPPRAMNWRWQLGS